MTLDAIFEHEPVEGFTGTSDKTLTYAIFVTSRCFTNGQKAVDWAWSRLDDLGPRLAKGRAEIAIGHGDQQRISV